MLNSLNESFFWQLRYDLKNLENTARQLESRNRSLETELQEKDINRSRMESDLKHTQDKLENMENIHNKELEAQKERVRPRLSEFRGFKYNVSEKRCPYKNLQLLSGLISGKRSCPIIKSPSERVSPLEFHPRKY